MSHEPNAEEWDNVWDSSISQKIVTWGRNIYNSYFIKELDKLSDSKTNLAELGCGSSSLTLQLAPRIKSVTGYDLSHSALRISMENAKRLKVKNATFDLQDCTKLKVPDNTYDLVWSQGLIEHFEDPLPIVKEHLRICKKGGHVLISVPYKYSYFYLWYQITRPKFMRWAWPWTEQDFYTEEKFLKLILHLPGRVRYDIFNIKPWIFGIIMMRIDKQ